jgi:signal transduction histidine kinase
VQLSIVDDGVGFVPDQLTAGLVSGGYGLQGIAERLTILGGSVTIQSAPGQGTTISTSVPCPNVSTDGAI